MAASPATIRMELDPVEARAQFDGPQRSVRVRVAEQALFQNSLSTAFTPPARKKRKV
jgi:hypothetical protein